MKRLLCAAALTLAAVPALAADVGLSISVGQPGFYGRLDIGDFPPPVLLYPQPVTIKRVPVGRAPVYLHVPPGHIKDWGKHCQKYNACGERVYFVEHDWYQREYVPRYQERHNDHRHDRHDSRQDDNRGGHEDRHRESHGKEHGNSGKHKR